MTERTYQSRTKPTLPGAGTGLEVTFKEVGGNLKKLREIAAQEIAESTSDANTRCDKAIRDEVRHIQDIITERVGEIPSQEKIKESVVTYLAQKAVLDTLLWLKDIENSFYTPPTENLSHPLTYRGRISGLDDLYLSQFFATKSPEMPPETLIDTETLMDNAPPLERDKIKAVGAHVISRYFDRFHDEIDAAATLPKNARRLGVALHRITDIHPYSIYSMRAASRKHAFAIHVMDQLHDRLSMPSLINQLTKYESVPSLSKKFMAHHAIQYASAGLAEEPKTPGRDQKILRNLLKGTPLEGNEALIEHMSLDLTSDQSIEEEVYRRSSVTIDLRDKPPKDQ